jgi:Catalase
MTKLTTAFGAPVVDDNNTMTAGPRGPALLQDVWFLEKLAHFDREVSRTAVGRCRRSRTSRSRRCRSKGRPRAGTIGKTPTTSRSRATSSA